MPAYIGKSGDLVGCHRCLTHRQTTEYIATQLVSSIKFKLSHAISSKGSKCPYRLALAILRREHPVSKDGFYMEIRLSWLTRKKMVIKKVSNICVLWRDKVENLQMINWRANTRQICHRYRKNFSLTIRSEFEISHGKNSSLAIWNVVGIKLGLKTNLVKMLFMLFPLPSGLVICFKRVQ